jgi:non-specific serine/threonine protein kinase
MDWSHDLLAPDERRMFRRLGVFAGSFGLDAAEAVAALSPGDTLDALDGLTGLVEKSLLTVQEGAGTVPLRYRMLETVRRYAEARLAEAGERSAARDRHAAHFLDVAARAEAGLRGPQQGTWMRHLALEHAQLTAALAWLHERGDTERGLRLAGMAGRYWWMAGAFTEGAAWLTTFLERSSPDAQGVDRARALHALGLATFWHESPAAGFMASRSWFEQAAAIYRRLGDDRALAETLRDLGGFWKGMGDLARGRQVLEESASVAARCGDERGVAAARSYLGIVLAYAGELAAARDVLTESLDVLVREAGPDEYQRTRFFLSCIASDAGDAAAARAWLEEIMATDDVMADLPYAAGFVLDGLARLAVAEHQPHKALRLAGAAAAEHERLGTSAGPAYDRYVLQGLEPAVAAIGGEAAHRAMTRGRTTPLPEAFAEALRPPPVPLPRDGGAAPGPLSAREAEVLQLVAEGLSDADIASTLHLSRRTVGNHLGSVYRKLGVSSRTAAVREAAELHLLP